MAEDILPSAQDRAEAKRLALVRWRAHNPDKVAAQRQRQNAQRRAASPEAKAQARRQRRARYLANKPHEIALVRAWQAAHPDAKPVQFRAWLAANYQARLAYNRAWREANNEQANATQRARNKRQRAENPAPYREAEKRYRAKKYGAARIDLTPEQWHEILLVSDYCCVYCGAHGTAETLEQEHLTPVAAHGEYTVWNIVPACRSCNARKGTGAVLKPVQPLLLTVAPPRKRKASLMANGQEG